METPESATYEQEHEEIRADMALIESTLRAVSEAGACHRREPVGRGTRKTDKAHNQFVPKNIAMSTTVCSV